MIILEDTAQKINKHLIKNSYFAEQGVNVHRVPLPVGDYVLYNDKIADVMERKAKRGLNLKKMDFLGTYHICVDSKFDIQELVGDICGKSHDRFRDECLLAQNNGIKLYILVENEGGLIPHTKDAYNKTVRSIGDLFSWSNPRSFIWKHGVQVYKGATKGATLAKACITMQKKYGCSFIFCRPEEAGEYILSLLNRKLEE